MKSEINKLEENLSRGLYLDNLDEMVGVCDHLVRKSTEPLPAYVLLSIFKDIYHSWDGKPLTVEEADYTEKSLLPILKNVVHLMKGDSGDKNELWDILNNLIDIHIHLED